MPYLKYLWTLTDGFHLTTILRTLLGILRVALTLTIIWLSKTIIDCATGRIPAPTSVLIGYFAAIIISMLAEMFIAQWVRYIESRANIKMNNTINRRLFNVLLTLPLVNGRQGFHSGDMLNRLTLDVTTVSSFALSKLPTMIVMIVQIVSSFIFLASLSPWLALVPVIIMPVCLIAGKLYFRRQRTLTAEIRREESNAHVAIQEGLRHRMLIRTLECIDEIDRRLNTVLLRLDAANKEQTLLSRTSGSIIRLGFILGYLTAFGWSIFSLRAGLITFGTMTAFIQLVNRIQNPIAGLSGYLPAFISTSVALDRLREIDYPLPPKNDSPKCVPLQNPGVRISNLTFRYDSDPTDLISSFTHDFRPGSRTMIIGPTGAGKTTLIKLLLGILTPQKGSIEIYDATDPNPTPSPKDNPTSSPKDNQPTSPKDNQSSSPKDNQTTSPKETQSVKDPALCNFVYVPQGNSLLQGTIRDNLLLAAPEATGQQIAEALYTAAAEFVYDLPEGLDTSCDESGAGLSEGQAQRIAIARALLRPGRILLLDEFNSALDPDTAATLMQRLTARAPQATIIIIAHHRSPIAPYCDTILPLPK